MDRRRTMARDDTVMVAVKAHQAEAFLKSPERMPPAVLFYGTDAGLVSERAADARAAPGRARGQRGAAPRRRRPRERSGPHQRRAADRGDVRRPQGGARAGRAARQRQCAEAARRGRQHRRLSDRRGRQPAPRRSAAHAVREVGRRGSGRLLSRRGARSRCDGRRNPARSRIAASRRRPSDCC